MVSRETEGPLGLAAQPPQLLLCTWTGEKAGMRLERLWFLQTPWA